LEIKEQTDKGFIPNSRLPELVNTEGMFLALEKHLKIKKCCLLRCYEVWLTTATWHNIPGDGILHSHRHENLISYM
jgi:hypothetical protein